MTLKKRKVLIVEDDQTWADLLKSEFNKNMSYRAVVALNFSEALWKYKNEEFDVIILDLKLERRSGIEFVEYVNANKHSQNHNETNIDTKIVILSGTVKYNHVLDLKNKVTQILTKPILHSEVVEKVDSLFK